MNRIQAKRIAETITNEQIKQMFEDAKQEIKDWTKVSNVNKSMTKGTAWNILAKDFDVNKKYDGLAKTNMVWEFGNYLPSELKPQKPKNPEQKLIHQDPKF